MGSIISDDCKGSIHGLSKLSLDSFVKEDITSSHEEDADSRDREQASSSVNLPLPTDEMATAEQAVDEAQQRQSDLEQAAATPIPSTLPRHRSSSSAETSTLLSSSTEDYRTADSIPSQAFSMIFLDFLLDRNSNLAAYGQQCIVNIASHLSYISTSQEEPSTNLTPDIAKELLRIDIFEGVIMKLFNIANGIQPVQHKQQSTNGQTPDTGAENSVGVDESDMNLGKMMCLSVSCFLRATG